MLFDTHAHYNLSPIYESWQEHWAKAQENGVTKSIVVGAGMGSSQKAVEIAAQADGLYAAIGKHPDVYRQAIKIKLQNRQDWQTAFFDIKKDISAFRKIIMANKKDVVAVGEVGLDYYRMPEKGDKREWMIKTQKEAFRAHISLAEEFDLPVIVHVRDKAGSHDAHYDALEIIKSAGKQMRFVLHCISGPIEYVQQALELGAYIGVDGNISYENTQDLKELISLVPDNKLLLETDAPYLAPQPHKDKACDPWMVKLVAEYLEENLSISTNQLYKNACEFFNVE